MINHERRFVFVHIPKTAGMSIYEALGVDRGFGHLRLHDHPAYDPSYFSFTIVRSPWDRAVSTYAYLRGGGRGNQSDLAASRIVADCDTFDRFARRIERFQELLGMVRAPGWGIPFPTSGSADPHDLRYPYLLPQVEWTHDHTQRPTIEMIGRFERLDADLQKAGRRIGGLAPLPHNNASVREGYRSNYSWRARRAVARAYADDIEAFGYRF